MDKSHSKMLKKIKKAGIYDFTNSSKEEKAIIEYLGQQGYMKYYLDEDEDPRTSKKLRCVIREEGKAALYDWERQNYSIKIPIAISIFAAIGGYRKELALLAQVLTRLWKQLMGI